MLKLKSTFFLNNVPRHYSMPIPANNTSSFQCLHNTPLYRYTMINQFWKFKWLPGFTIINNTATNVPEQTSLCT